MNEGGERETFLKAYVLLLVAMGVCVWPSTGGRGGMLRRMRGGRSDVRRPPFPHPSIASGRVEREEGRTRRREG